MGTTTAQYLKSCAGIIDEWVAGQHERNRVRKQVQQQARFDPKSVSAQVQDQLREIGEVERAMDLLADALKNAQPALDKLRAQARKDEAAMLASVASGGGADSIGPKTPFVVALAAAGEPIAAKAKQAATEVALLIKQIYADQTLQGALKSRSETDTIVRLLEEAQEQLKKTAGIANHSCETVADDL